MFLFVKIAAKLYHTPSLAWPEECWDQEKNDPLVSASRLPCSL